MRKNLASAFAFAAGLALSVSVPAFAAGTVTAATNAGSDPYASCTVGAGTGRFYTRSEVEPYGAVDPLDANHIIAVFQQDRVGNGGAHGLAASVTANGGATWTVVPLPFSACASNAPSDLQYERASDPWVSFGPGTEADPSSGSTAYAISISFNQSLGKNGNTVGVAASSDGGITWTHAQSLHGDPQTGAPLPVPDSNFQYFHDKESVTADPTMPGTAYAVWDVLIGNPTNPDADLHSVAFSDLTLFSRTSDFGATWSPARTINNSAHPTTQNNQTIGNVIVVDPRTGTLYDFFDQIYGTGSNSGGNPGGAHGYNVAFQKSTDHGASWTAPQIISRLGTAFVSDPNNVNPVPTSSGKFLPPAPVRTGDIIPEPAIDPRTGDLYAVWQDARFSGFDEIAISRSTDGGATWSTPQRVNTPTGGQAFTPSVAVTDSGSSGTAGTVGVTYYQFGTTTPGSEPTSYFIKKFAGAAIGSSNIDTGVTPALVAGPFNMLDAPYAGGYFTGDYEALATSGSGASAGFVPVFVQGACGLALSCSALTSVTPPADRTPTGKNSTDVYVGTGF
jgi:hypothetical protein